MKTNRLSLDKFRIARLTGSFNVMGGHTGMQTHENTCNDCPPTTTDTDESGHETCPTHTETTSPTNPNCILTSQVHVTTNG